MKEKMAAIMAVAKKNMVSIVCGLIALIAVGAIFWPVSGYYAELTNSAQARSKEYGELNTLLTKQRNLPSTDPSAAEGATTPSLDQFPTQPVITAWKSVSDRINSESDKMFALAVEMNKGKHTLLSENALPKGSIADMLQFRTKYRAMMDNSTPEMRKTSLVGVILRAGTPPTIADVDAAKRQVDVDMKPNENAMPAAAFKEEVERKKLAVQEDLRQAVAKNCSIYVNFDPQPAIEPYGPLMVTTGGTSIENSAVFLGQLSLWVQEDVLRALAAANKGADTVINAPVKHLMSMRIAPSSLAAFTLTSGATPPPAPTTEPSATIEKKPISPTQRTSNGLYDVIRFNLRLVVDAEQVPRVLQELSRNQLITVTNVNMRTMDLGRAISNGYLYGDKPVVYLDMSCEELLLRRWTTPYMPSSVKQALGLEPPSAAPTPQ